MATPFQYGLVADPQSATYPLNPGNAAPALVVWMFLVTQPDFLKFLTDPATSGTPVAANKIAQYTNLLPGAVSAILDSYRNASLQRQLAFNDVSAAFQELCAANNDGYLPNECPHDELPMLWLARQGAGVDPAATNLPPLPPLDGDEAASTESRQE